MATNVSSVDPSIAASSSAPALIDNLRRLDISGLTEPELQSVLQSTRQLQRSFEGLIYRVGAEADRRAAQGHSPPADEFLSDNGNIRSHTARRQAARAQTVAGVDGLSEVVDSGEVGADHIDSLTQRFKKLTDDERLRIDDIQLVRKARELSAERFDRVVRDAVDRARDDHGLKNAQQKRQASEFTHWFDHKTGMGKFRGQLDPERYEALTTAIDYHTSSLAATANPRDLTKKDAALAATALAELVSTSPNRSRDSSHITIVVDQKTLTEGAHDAATHQTGNGHNVPPQTVERLGCNSVLQKVVLDDRGVPLKVGRKYRTATNAQWTALQAIYSSCAWKGCDRPFTWCQLHHINEWHRGGTTDLANLVPLCSTHHHRVHEGQWSIELKQDRRLLIWKPNGDYYDSARPSRLAESTSADHRRLLRPNTNLDKPPEQQLAGCAANAQPVTATSRQQ